MSLEFVKIEGALNGMLYAVYDEDEWLQGYIRRDSRWPRIYFAALSDYTLLDVDRMKQITEFMEKL